MQRCVKRWDPSGAHPVLVRLTPRRTSRDPRTRGCVTSILQRGVISILRLQKRPIRYLLENSRLYRVKHGGAFAFRGRKTDKIAFWKIGVLPLPTTNHACARLQARLVSCAPSTSSLIHGAVQPDRYQRAVERPIPFRIAVFLACYRIL
jgi:hypothetical protein